MTRIILATVLGVMLTLPINHRAAIGAAQANSKLSLQTTVWERDIDIHLTNSAGCDVHIKGRASGGGWIPSASSLTSFKGTVTLSGPGGCPQGTITFSAPNQGGDVQPNFDDPNICGATSVNWSGNNSSALSTLNEPAMQAGFLSGVRGAMCEYKMLQECRK